MATSDQRKELKTLVKGDLVIFQEGSEEREGSIITVDRFKRELTVDEDDQCLTVPIHLIKITSK